MLEDLLPLPTTARLEEHIAEVCYQYPQVGGINIDVQTCQDLDLDEMYRYAKHQSEIRRQLVEAMKRQARKKVR